MTARTSDILLALGQAEIEKAKAVSESITSRMYEDTRLTLAAIQQSHLAAAALFAEKAKHHRRLEDAA